MQDNQENKNPQGEKVDEINSELTEIIGLQKTASQVESEFEAVQVYDALINKIDLHIRSRAKDNKHDNDLELLADIIFEHRNDGLEDVKSVPRVKDWLSTSFLQIGNDPTTKTIVTSENYKIEREALERKAYARLKEKRLVQFRKMIAILSDDFDLRENLAHDKFNRNKLNKMIADRSNKNG